MDSIRGNGRGLRPSIPLWVSYDAQNPVRAGPGKAYTAKEQAELLFDIAGQPPKFLSVPVALMDFIIGAMELIGKIIPPVGVRH